MISQSLLKRDFCTSPVLISNNDVIINDVGFLANHNAPFCLYHARLPPHLVSFFLGLRIEYGLELTQLGVSRNDTIVLGR